MIRVIHSEGDKERFTKLIGLEENESHGKLREVITFKLFYY